MRLPDQAGDIGGMGIYDERGHDVGGYGGNPGHLGAMHPTPGTMRRHDNYQQSPYQHQETGVVESRPLDDLDTGYHGAHQQQRPAYAPPPGVGPQRVPRRPAHEGWNDWERDLGPHEGAHF